MDIELGKLEHLDPRKIWINEATDFTPWLADHIELLGEALGLDLQLEQREAAVGDFSCDILAREVGANRPVIIENQLERTDHGHLGQLLTYAGGLDAAIVVWISPEIRDEHRKALDWLNRHTDEEIDFFGVVVEAIQIDESKPAVQFRPVAVPNSFGKRPPPASVPEQGLIRQAFFQGLIDELREKHKFTNSKIGSMQSWHSFSSGNPGITYIIAFARVGLSAEAYIDTRNTARNKAIFDWLLNSKEEIESEMQATLVWERLDNRQSSRIRAVLPNVSSADTAARADELRKWSIDHLLKLKKVFGPRLPGALAASASTEELETA